MRIVRVPVFHEGTFRALVKQALRGQRCFRYARGYWEPFITGRRFGIYRRAPDGLACIQERVEHYEFFLYSRLLTHHCGQDGALRPRSSLRRRVGGAYGPRDAPARRWQ